MLLISNYENENNYMKDQWKRQANYCQDLLFSLCLSYTTKVIEVFIENNNEWLWIEPKVNIYMEVCLD